MKVLIIFAIGLLGVEKATGLKCYTCKPEEIDQCVDGTGTLDECAVESNSVNCSAIETSKDLGPISIITELYLKALIERHMLLVKIWAVHAYTKTPQIMQ